MNLIRRCNFSLSLIRLACNATELWISSLTSQQWREGSFLGTIFVRKKEQRANSSSSSPPRWRPSAAHGVSSSNTFLSFFVFFFPFSSHLCFDPFSRLLFFVIEALNLLSISSDTCLSTKDICACSRRLEIFFRLSRIDSTNIFFFSDFSAEAKCWYSGEKDVQGECLPHLLWEIASIRRW